MKFYTKVILDSMLTTQAITEERLLLTAPCWVRNNWWLVLKVTVKRKLFCPDLDPHPTKLVVIKSSLPRDCAIVSLWNFACVSPHFSDVIMGTMASQMTSLKWPVTRKMFPFDDIIMETLVKLQSDHDLPCGFEISRVLMVGHLFPVWIEALRPL